MGRRSTKSSATLLAVLLALASCAKEPEQARAAGTPAPRDGAAPRRRSGPERSRDVRAALLRRLLEEGRTQEAGMLLEQVAPLLGVEGRLLEARWLALRGDHIGWQRTVNEVRAKEPEDPRVYATAAELACLAGFLKEAQRELEDGIRACGATPELDRAQGVYYLSQQGGARRGLELLERARERDPELPFTSRALNQAHLLIAREALADKDGRTAMEHAKLAYEADREDVDTRRLLADVYAGLADYESALAILKELIDEGLPLQVEYALMHKQAAVVALLEDRREEALAWFLAARRAGLTDEELGTGARLLDEEAERRIEAGLGAFGERRYDEARAELERAVELAPARLEAQHRLGVVLFTMKDYAAAAERWRHVNEIAMEEHLELPDPAHIHLSRALFRSGDIEGARLVLEEYLDRRPFGQFVDETREQLELLPD